MPKQREKNSCWTTTIDDFGLWQGEECEKDATPLLGSVSVSKAHVLSKKINATSSRSVNQVGSQLQSRKADDFHESISSVNYTKAQESSVVSSCLPSTVQASIEPTRRPWEYSKQTVREPVVSIPYKLPLVLTATSENKSTESAAQSVDPLPPFIYRKPGTVREPLQKTIKAPFQPVEKENIRQQTVSRFEPTLQHSPSVRSQRQDPSSSSSTAPSRIFDNRSVSSRTIVSSSPYRNNQYNSNPPVKKGSYPTSNRRPQPARVTYRKSITNQSRLAFEPVPRQNRQSRPPSSPISEFQQRSNDRSSVQPSLSASMSYDSSSPHQALTWTPQVVKGHDSSEYLPSDYTRTSQNESTGRFPLYNNMHSSLRSAMEQAIDKDFLRSFQDSPVRGRIAADCQTSRSKGWASAAYSAEERRLRQYPQVFDQDPGEEREDC